MHGPGTFLFFGLKITQETDYSITVQADDKLTRLECHSIDLNRRKQKDDVLNDLEFSSFRSVNSSIGWIGIAASTFCAFYASYLQQEVPDKKFSDLISQINALRLLKKLGTAFHYKRPNDKKEHSISVVVFADASRLVDYGQLAFVAGLLFGNFDSGSIFHTLAWSSHKSKRPVRSIGAAEILAAGEAIDEAKVLVKAYQVLFGIHVDLVLVVDSKDLFETLSTCQNSLDRSIRADANVTRCYALCTSTTTFDAAVMNWI